MGVIKSIFGRLKNYATNSFRELGSYTARFSSFDMDMYSNDVVRACVRTLAETTSKANCKVLRNGEPANKALQRIIEYRPNIYMNGKDFLYKIRTHLELYNVVFIYIMRDDFGRCVGLYPMPAGSYEALEGQTGLFIKFSYPSGISKTIHWDDLAVLRKDYNSSDIWGDRNTAILNSLNILHTANEGLENAIKSTANLRGIITHTKAGLNPDDVRKFNERFIEDYMSLANGSGIASLDSYQKFEAINIAPTTANFKNIEELRNNIYRYFGINEGIITGTATSTQREAFYEARIEPFLIALSLELTNKIFSVREQGFENEITFESNRMSYMSMRDKLALLSLVDRGAMTPNEWRQALNLAPIKNGDEPIRRLDTAVVKDVNLGGEEDD